MLKVADNSFELACRAYAAGEIDVAELTRLARERAQRRIANMQARLEERMRAKGLSGDRR